MKKLKLKKGDRVQVTLVGEVDFSVQLGSLVVGRGLYANVIRPDAEHVISIRKVAPKRPAVGERIPGSQVRATPWKRGTTLAEYGNFDEFSGTYFLQGNGKWIYFDEDGNLYDDCDHGCSMSFAGFPDNGAYEVVYLP